jgi:hypothetical protein
LSNRGDNIAGAVVEFEVRLYNSISALAGGGHAGFTMQMPAGSSVGDLLEALAIPVQEVFLVLINGRDITPSLYGGVRTDYYIQDGDRVAFSGPVPYGWGYGSPVV